MVREEGFPDRLIQIGWKHDDYLRDTEKLSTEVQRGSPFRRNVTKRRRLIE